MIRKLLIATFCFLGYVTVHAQQDPLYGLWLNNPIAINPAYTGLNNNFNITAGFRKQWSGFDGSPTTLSFTPHTSIAGNKMGVGLILINDQIGDITNTQATASYSYKVQLSGDKILSFGMQAGVQNFKSGGKVLVQDPSDGLFAPVSQIQPLIGAGVILKSERYMFGLSVPRLLNATFNVQGQSFNVYQQHFYLFGAYVFDLTERILFKPSVLIKAVKGSPVSADVNLNLNFDRNYTVGIYTRNLNSYGVLAQLNFLDYWRLAYALEIPTNKSVGTRFATNEINLGVKFSAFRFHEKKTITNF